MRFDILTIFPGMFESFMRETLIAKAIKKKRMAIYVHNIRRATNDKHHTVDDRPYGGGPGMILKVDPILKTLRMLPKKKKRRIILLSPQGTQFSQKVARRLAGYEQIILISGRYEGFDHRVTKYVDEELSIGPYVMSGGEIPAMVVVETVSRLIPGVIGHPEATRDETYSGSPDYVEYPQYTRPPVYRRQSVPKVLLSGNHKEIRAWRQFHSRRRKSGSRAA
ncbi:MAG TPA: tRNA (guanosine(37)-N1)-methyltransferase TrmD [Candidatus Kerfeldbacteria bacterium]|nr:MAG: tRNA (guanine-N(1)-)-methyltransferase [Parcubacteria group bacterium GW2011_GWC2_49_9]HCJ52909.1 tRNA (guanosine(37)-N1)-methyltransferase TrmD [Candidatus Kerfeldbacteria bacterium]